MISRNGLPSSHSQCHQGCEEINSRPALRGNSRIAKRRRFDLMLSEVEGGCFGQIRAFAKEWPSELPLAKRAFQAILAHLNVDEVLQLHQYHLSNQPATSSETEAPEKSIVITSCMTTVEEIFVQLETAPPDYTSQLLEVFWPHLPGFLATLSYYAHHAPWLMSTTNPWIQKIQSGNAIRASLLKRLLGIGFHSLRAQPDSDHMIRRIVDEVFQSWLWGFGGEQAEDSSEDPITPEGYKESHHPLLLGLMWKCMVEEETMDIIIQKIAASNQQFHRRLVQSFVHRCREWIAVYKPTSREETGLTMDCGHLISLVLTCQDLGSDSKVSHTVAKSRFSSFILSCAEHFKDTPSSRSCGGTVATELAALVFLPRRPYAYELKHMVPEVIDAGLLTYIIDDLLAPHQTQTNLFPSWWDRNPLDDLYTISHHPNISRAIYRAVAGLPQSTKEAIEANPLARKHWGAFTRSIQLYQSACEQWVDADCVRICDNPQHHSRGYRPVTNSFQCSWCQAVVYCSRKCQREDWDKLHRKECERARAKRIESQIHGDWLSLRSRMAYFYLLEQGLLQQILPSQTSQEDDSEDSDSSYDSSEDEDSEGTDSEGDEDVVYWADTRKAPMKFRPLPLKNFCEKNVSGIQFFVDARGEALLQKSQESSVYLVSSASRFGECVVVVLAAFKVIQQGLGSDGSELPPKVLLLHGMVEGRK